MDSESLARHQGWMCRKSGGGPSDNPYDFGTDEHQAWCGGADDYDTTHAMETWCYAYSGHHKAMPTVEQLAATFYTTEAEVERLIPHIDAEDSNPFFHRVGDGPLATQTFDVDAE